MAGGRLRDEGREAQWRRVVRGQRRSGLTIREFCSKSNLPESAFYFWRRQLERRGAVQEQLRRRRRPAAAPGPARPPAFVAVRVAEQTPSQSDGRIEIVLPSGRRVHVRAPVDRQALADVLAVLEGQAC
jgi:transposase-like protein